MELGLKLGEGAGSEAYAWGDQQIVKLFKDGIDRRIVEYEVRVTRTAFEAGAPAPEVQDMVEVDGRLGIVFPRYDGETLLQKVIAGSISAGAAGETMARLAHSIHAPGYRTSLNTFRKWAQFSIGELRKRGIPEDALNQVQRTLMTLPEAGVLCHGDLHADNILMTASGPVAIDWISALSAHPFMDVARQHLSFTVLLIDRRISRDEVVTRLEALRAEADEAFVATYADLAKTSTEDLLSAIAPYMVVMAAMRLMESGSTEEERLALVDFIRATGT